jgi:hypothetical protein
MNVKFNSKAGIELRTWILFIVGVILVFIFAWQKNPLNPWWTLIIGAFTCTAIIVSAVQTVMGGVSDSVHKAIEDELRRLEMKDENEPPEKSEKPDAASYSTILGPLGFYPIRWVCSSN